MESDKNTRKHHIQEIQEVSPFSAGDHMTPVGVASFQYIHMLEATTIR